MSCIVSVSHKILFRFGKSSKRASRIVKTYICVINIVVEHTKIVMACKNKKTKTVQLTFVRNRLLNRVATGNNNNKYKRKYLSVEITRKLFVFCRCK